MRCVLIGASVILPLLFPFRTQPRPTKILTLFLAFSPCFILLSICAEGLFYLTYCATLLVWVKTESSLRKANDALRSKTSENGSSASKPNGTSNPKSGSMTESDYKLRADDVRIAVFFLFFVQIAFFGTGK